MPYKIALVGLRDFDEDFIDIIQDSYADIHWMTEYSNYIFSSIYLGLNGFEWYTRLDFITMRSDIKYVPYCDCILVIPMTPVTKDMVNIVHNIREYNKYTCPIIVAYPNESSIDDDVVLADVPYKVDYFTTNPLLTLNLLCTVLLSLHYDKYVLDIDPTYSIELHIDLLKCHYDIRSQYLLNNAILSCNDIDSYCINTHMGFVHVTTPDIVIRSPYAIYVVICHRHDVNLLSAFIRKNCHDYYIIVIVLIPTPSCTSSTCKYECNNIKSTYNRKLEKLLHVTKCISVYDTEPCTVLQHIMSLVYNNIDITIIPHCY